jgi:Mg-chelatase subunit ChlD
MEHLENDMASHQMGRRELLKALAAGGGAIAVTSIMPGKWAKPIIEAGLLPAHAQGSPDKGDTDVPIPSFRCLELQNNVDVMLTLDTSGSVGDQTEDAKKALKKFVEGRDLTKDQIGVVSFDYEIDKNTFQTLTRVKDTLDGKITKIISGGRTSVAIGVLKSTEELTSSRRDPNNQPVIILISDGDANELTAMDQASRDQAREAANRAKQQGIRMITIAIGDPSITTIRTTLLRDMASAESDFYHVLDPQVLLRMFDVNCSNARRRGRENLSSQESPGDDPIGDGPGN